MNYTKGPWAAQQSDNNEYEWEVIHNERYIAVICDEPGYGGTAEDNAHLIAAAPELLEALSDLLELHEDEPNRPAVAAARGAIAKAKGK